MCGRMSGALLKGAGFEERPVLPEGAQQSQATACIRGIPNTGGCRWDPELGGIARDSTGVAHQDGR